MPIWYFCSLCREGDEKTSSSELLDHIFKKHKCDGWSKFNGYPKNECIIKFHFDIMNPQERICTSMQSVSVKCYICSSNYTSSVDYVSCVQRHVDEDKVSQQFRDEFPSQDDEILIGAANDMDQAEDQVNVMLTQDDGFLMAAANDMDMEEVNEMLTQDDIVLDMHAQYIEEMILQKSQNTVQNLINGKKNSKNIYKIFKFFKKSLKNSIF